MEKSMGSENGTVETASWARKNFPWRSVSIRPRTHWYAIWGWLPRLMLDFKDCSLINHQLLARQEQEVSCPKFAKCCKRYEFWLLEHNRAAGADLCRIYKVWTTIWPSKRWNWLCRSHNPQIHGKRGLTPLTPGMYSHSPATHGAGEGERKPTDYEDIKETGFEDSLQKSFWDCKHCRVWTPRKWDSDLHRSLYIHLSRFIGGTEEMKCPEIRVTFRYGARTRDSGP